MSIKMKEEFLNYMRRAIVQTNFRLRGYVVNNQGFLPAEECLLYF